MINLNYRVDLTEICLSNIDQKSNSKTKEALNLIADPNFPSESPNKLTPQRFFVNTDGKMEIFSTQNSQFLVKGKRERERGGGVPKEKP